MLKQFKSTSLADQVFDRLENDIIQGVYAKGEILTELKLVEQLGVSRTPIREALRRLEQEQRREGREQLALAVRRAAVACYAAEGAYPAQLSHLQNHYGLVFDRERYAVLYESVGANLMPEITVVEP